MGFVGGELRRARGVWVGEGAGAEGDCEGRGGGCIGGVREEGGDYGGAEFAGTKDQDWHWFWRVAGGGHFGLVEVVVMVSSPLTLLEGIDRLDGGLEFMRRYAISI